MKKITTKLSNLHKIFNVSEYEKELYVNDIFIEDQSGDFVKVNALVLKKTPMIKCIIEGIAVPYVAANEHLIMTPNGWEFLKDATEVLHKSGQTLKILSKELLDEQDAYDVSLDHPHSYCTANGLIHHNTFLAMYKSLEEVLDKSNPFEQVVVVRSLVQLREVGHLPGDLEEKQAIYELPYKEICSTLFGKPDAWDRLKEQKKCRFLSTTAIRGISIDNSIIIVDECQNLNWSEVNTIMSRVGHRSKIIFCGDFKQSDLIKSSKDVSSFHEFRKVALDMPAFQEVYFTPEDIVRSSLVKQWIIACEKNGH